MVLKISDQRESPKKYFLCGIIIWPSTQQIQNKQSNISVLTFDYYSVSPACFDPAGSSSGSFS
jgi:hypothetical protein